MTFKEFFNKRDNAPFMSRLKPSIEIPKQDFEFEKPTVPHTTPTLQIKRPVMGVGRTRLADRPVEKKPTNFLPRYKNILDIE